MCCARATPSRLVSYDAFLRRKTWTEESKEEAETKWRCNGLHKKQMSDSYSGHDCFIAPFFFHDQVVDVKSPIMHRKEKDKKK